MAYHPFRHLGLKVVALVLREPPVADRRGRARRRAQPARAGRIPQHSAAARGRRRSARQRRRPAARFVGAAQPAGARRGRRGGRSAAGASGIAAVSHPPRGSAIAIRRGGRAGHAGHAGHRAREDGAPHRAGDCRDSTAILRRGSWSGRSPQSRRWSRSTAREPRQEDRERDDRADYRRRRRDNVRDVVAVGLIDSACG